MKWERIEDSYIITGKITTNTRAVHVLLNGKDIGNEELMVTVLKGMYEKLSEPKKRK